MSLLSRGAETVTLWPEVEAADVDGTPVRVPGAVPVEVVGHVQPVASVEGEPQSVATTYRLICADLPGGAWAHAQWRGRTWSVEGEPSRRGDSAATRHVTVLLRARVAEPLT